MYLEGFVEKDLVDNFFARELMRGFQDSHAEFAERVEATEDEVKAWATGDSNLTRAQQRRLKSLFQRALRMRGQVRAAIQEMELGEVHESNMWPLEISWKGAPSNVTVVPEDGGATVFIGIARLLDVEKHGYHTIQTLQISSDKLASGEFSSELSRKLTASLPRN